MTFDLDASGDRWVIGKRTAPRCRFCGAEPVATVARNGKAEVWHPPFDCCEEARSRNARLRLGDSDARARGEGA